ncbi:MAG: hypothetical protein SFV51_21770 [Bryobacteraceae bacterium]|nr:hypothetical protein [Bryobacteraceae bacterium]
MIIRRLFCVILIPILFAGCSRSGPEAAKKGVSPPAFHIDGAAANDAARFLAGLPGRKSSPFHQFEQNAAWRAYANEFQSKWNDLKATQIAAVSTFQQREIAPALARSKSSYVFYPFSGPDILYLKTFFPGSSISVLVGLEPVGNLPSPHSFSSGDLNADLQGWRIGIASLYKRTFFVTSEMDRQFRGRVADGLLPMIAMLLARTGHTIDAIRFIRLGEKGEPLNEDESKPLDENGKKHKHQGVEIVYRLAGDSVTRRLYYFSTDMAKFGANLPFQAFLKSLGRADTFIKSASFLLHWRMCDDVRAFILENSNMILEDDTGVPYNFFKRGKWQTVLFGQYSRPDRPFKKEHQPDLEKAFADRQRVRPLGFSLGYGSGRRPSHLLLAMRTPETVAVKPMAPIREMKEKEARIKQVLD